MLKMAKIGQIENLLQLNYEDVFEQKYIENQLQPLNKKDNITL
jgi:hypothetical protein